MSRILIIKLGALGDVIMAIPAIRQIQRHHQNDEIWLLTTPPFFILFRNWEGLEVAALPRQGFFSVPRSVRWIRQHKFDILYDLQSNDRTSIISALSGIPERIGNHPRFPYHRHPPKPYVGQCHSSERTNQILLSANIDPAPLAPWLPKDKLGQSVVKSWLDMKGILNKKLVLLHAGSSKKHPDKRWPHFGELAQSLEKHSYRVLWIGGSDDLEINRKLATKAGVDASNAFDILQLVELGRLASFAVTNDSAPMHILSCAMIPVYGLFGPTNWRRTHALGQQHRVITPATDIISQDNTFTPRPLDTLSIQHVLERLENDGLI
jgi:ADP-heptose:LPS heptosyltransferase